MVNIFYIFSETSRFFLGGGGLTPPPPTWMGKCPLKIDLRVGGGVDHYKNTYILCVYPNLECQVSDLDPDQRLLYKSTEPLFNVAMYLANTWTSGLWRASTRTYCDLYLRSVLHQLSAE